MDEPDLTRRIRDIEREYPVLMRSLTNDREYYEESATPYRVTTRLSGGHGPSMLRERVITDCNGRVLATVPYQD